MVCNQQDSALYRPYLGFSMFSWIRRSYTSKSPTVYRLFSFIAINIIMFRVSAAKEQEHVSPLPSSCYWWLGRTFVVEVKHSLLPKGAKRSDTCPIPHKDHGSRTIGWETEGLGAKKKVEDISKHLRPISLTPTLSKVAEEVVVQP